MPVRRALLSVSDKTGLVDFAKELHDVFKVELIATGGTKKVIADAGLPVRDVSELTNFPEILDGRVKTLHPAIFAGLLAKRDNDSHMATLASQKLAAIDLVVCNLYPFEETIAKPDVTEAMAIENIDIGGPCMVRAAAKNFHAVNIVIDPVQYNEFLLALKNGDGETDLDYRRELATAAFQRIAEYDAEIAEYFVNQLPDVVGEDDELEDVTGWVEEFDPPFNLHQTLRYGENPHQEAAFYIEPDIERSCVATAEQLHGKELSYNNILDLDAALNLVREFSDPAAVVIKHTNPCGAATAKSIDAAFLAAWDGDPLSAFGGILAFNQPVNLKTAKAMTEGDRFLECVIAPDYDDEALAMLKGWKKNVRLLRVGDLKTKTESSLDYRRVDGGLLVQTRDLGMDDREKWNVVTKRQPTKTELDALWFAWLTCKHVKSNAITLANGNTLVGCGAGQMSRVMSVEIAIRKAGAKAKGSVLASDAFFPFPDNVELAAAAGVTAIVQPGGSVKDADSIAACDSHGIAMVFTGVRHFKH